MRNKFWVDMQGGSTHFPIALIIASMLFDVTGSGLLAKHHLFVWLAFALIVGLAVWWLVVRQKASRRAYALYLTASVVTAVLVALAGYCVGEMLVGG